MALIQYGIIALLVNGYILNNGIPYFQKAVPKDLRKRIGKSTIKISLRTEKSNLALKCHRLNANYTALFKLMSSNGTCFSKSFFFVRFNKCVTSFSNQGIEHVQALKRRFGHLADQ